MPSLGPSLPLSPPPCLLPQAGDGPVHSRLALLWYSLSSSFWELAGSAILQSKLPSHVSFLRLPSGHSGPVLTLSNAARSSPFSPHLLVADASVWGTFLLGVVFRHVICGFYLFSLPVRLPSEIQKLPPDPPVRGFLVFGNFVY